MNYLTLSFNDKRISVTQHAKQRAMQRARLYLRDIEKDNLDYFLTRDFLSSKTDPKIINCPFYQNKYSTKHGEGNFKSSSKLFDYHCQIRNNTIVICTVVFIQNK